MAFEIKIPNIGESITEVTIAVLLVEDGEYVALDQHICEMESDKATLELPAEKAGIITWKVAEGDDVEIGSVVAEIDTSAKPPKEAIKKEAVATETSNQKEAAKAPTVKEASTASYAQGHASPAAAKLMAESNIAKDQIKGSGKNGRITKADVAQLIKSGGINAALGAAKSFSRESKKEKLSRLRQTIGKRLLAAKHGTAMLTTFNEVNMEPVMQIRKKYKEAFKEKFGVSLGFMSFFSRAVCNALQEFPKVNAYIQDEFIEYHDYCDISIAVSTPKGLVVPVIRNAESLSLWETEAKIKELALKGRDGTLGLDEMEGGTFTISNGGVFGSLMSTPIINPPQSAILGMHKIEERPIVESGEVVVKPMMYLALSYDHRIIDGKESVSFLVKIKEQLENPEQLLFGHNVIELLLEL